MKILFTGASSFTGCWFVRQLLDAGHDVVAVYQSKQEEYVGPRKERLDLISNDAKCVFECSFGDDTFMSLLKEGGSWDMLCHHAAEVRDYKSESFDIASAVNSNCKNLYQIMDKLAVQGCRHMMMTGSVFEQSEGLGSRELEAFSPYGFSKGVTHRIADYLGSLVGINVSKFVIPNPFGMYEEPRFTNYLCKTWADGKVPVINTPDYVRDNIHVSLLTCVYADFVAKVYRRGVADTIKPSGYVETQAAFAERFADELGQRLNKTFSVDLAFQREFAEPRIRFNRESAIDEVKDWNESRAWMRLQNFMTRSTSLVSPKWSGIYVRSHSTACCDC